MTKTALLSTQLLSTHRRRGIQVGIMGPAEIGYPGSRRRPTLDEGEFGLLECLSLLSEVRCFIWWPACR